MFDDQNKITRFDQYVRDVSKVNWDILNIILLLMNAYVFVVGGSYLTRRH